MHELWTNNELRMNEHCPNNELIWTQSSNGLIVS